MATAVVHEAPSLAFLRFEQARRELSMKRTDALRRKKYEAEQQQKKADALEQRRAHRVAAIEKAWERRQLVVRVSYMVSQAASIAAGYAPGWGLAVLRAMQAGAKRRYDIGEVQVVHTEDEDRDRVLTMLGDDATSSLLAVASRRARNVAYFEKNSKQRLAEKVAGLAALQQRRDSRIAQCTAMCSRLEEKWRRLYLQRERNAEQHRRDAIRNKIASRSANERRGEVAAAIDCAVMGDLAPPTQLPSQNFVAVHATSVTTKPVFARADYSSLLAHVRCGASLSANVASLVGATQHIAAAVTRQIQRADFMSSTLPRPPATASRPQTGAANGRTSASAMHAATSSARPQSSSHVRPASASIGHLLSQPASFSSFVKEARRHRYEDAAASSATPLPVSRPRTGQQVTFQPSVLASVNQLEGALASNILRYQGHPSSQPATIGSGNLAVLASKGHPPVPAAVERLHRPKHPSPHTAFMDASRPPARSNQSAADAAHVVPRPPSEKPSAAARAPARRTIANTSPIKQNEHKASMKEPAAELPSTASAAGAKKKTGKSAKVRKRAPVTLDIPSSAINVFSLDNPTSGVNFAGALLKSRQQSR